MFFILSSSCSRHLGEFFSVNANYLIGSFITCSSCWGQNQEAFLAAAAFVCMQLIQHGDEDENAGEDHIKGGAVVRALASHQCGPGSNPGVDAICGLSLLLLLSLAPRGFSPGTPVFPSP